MGSMKMWSFGQTIPQWRVKLGLNPGKAYRNDPGRDE